MYSREESPTSDITFVQPSPEQVKDAAGIFLYGKIFIGEMKFSQKDSKPFVEVKLRIQCPPYEKGNPIEYWGTLSSTRWNLNLPQEPEWLSHFHEQTGTVLCHGIGERSYIDKNGIERRVLTCKNMNLSFFFTEQAAYMAVRPERPYGEPELVGAGLDEYGFD